MENIMQMVKEAASYIKSRIDFKPEIAVILGSGLGPLAGKVNNQIIIKYSEIPHFKTSTVAGHAGELIALRCNDGKRDDMIVEEINELKIVPRRVAADIDEEKDVADILLLCKEGVERLAPARLLVARDGGIAVTGEIGKPEFAEIEVVDKARPAGGGTRLGKVLAICEQVDERALARVASAADGDHGAFGPQKSAHFGGRLQKFRFFDLHEDLLTV